MCTVPHVMQIVKVYDAGVTMPLSCVLSTNNSLAVVKYPFNPLGNHVLINEWVAYSIANIISAPVPPFGCCLLDDKSEYDARFLKSVEFGNICFDSQNFGLCFFSSLVSKAVPMDSIYFPVMRNAANISLMLLLDYIVCNVDRHSGNVLFSSEDRNFYAIDYSNIFNSQRGWNATTLKQEILAKDYTGIHLLDKKGNGEVYNTFQPVLQLENLYTDAQSIKQILTYDALKSVIDSIPSAWNNFITSDEKLLLCEYLYNRVQNINVFCSSVEQGGR